MASRIHHATTDLGLKQVVNDPLHRRTRRGGGQFADPEVQTRMKRMTNWQRQQWHRLNCPVDPDKLDSILAMEKPA